MTINVLSLVTTFLWTRDSRSQSSIVFILTFDNQVQVMMG